MNSAQKGNAAELLVAKDLEARGYVVASRRHIGGAGDLLGVHPESGSLGDVVLVEVKACKRGRSPYVGFTRADREAMRATPFPPDSSRWLAVVRARSIEWVHEDDWP